MQCDFSEIPLDLRFLTNIPYSDVSLKNRRLMPKLSDFRREIFAQNFVANGFNSVKAHRAAGLSGNPTAAAGMRRHPEVEERIRELLADQMAELQVDALTVKRQIARIAFADPRALFDEHGNLIPIADLDDDTAATISGIEVEVKRDREGNHVSDIVKIKRHSSLDALVFLGKHFKLVGGENEGVNALANALADRLNAAKRRVAQQPATHPQTAALADVEEAVIIEPAIPHAQIQAVPLQGADDERLW